MKIYHLSTSLLERTEEKMFFHTQKYKIFRFNHAGMMILQIAKTFRVFSKQALIDAPALAHLKETDIARFFDKCVDNHLFLTESTSR